MLFTLPRHEPTALELKSSVSLSVNFFKFFGTIYFTFDIIRNTAISFDNFHQVSCI